MKNYITLLILVAFISVASSVATSRIISQPAQPKEVFTDWYAVSASMTSDIKRYHLKGFVVKAITGGGSSGTHYILVMEKY